MDVIIEPARARLNPHLKEAEIAAVKGGASGAFLGGFRAMHDICL